MKKINLFSFCVLFSVSLFGQFEEYIDSAFNNGSILELVYDGYNSSVYDLELEGSSTILLSRITDGSNNGFIVYKLNEDGTLNSSFGDNGVFSKLYSDGREIQELQFLKKEGQFIILVTCFSNDGNKVNLYKVTSQGILDTSFGIGGELSFNTLLDIPATENYFSDIEIVDNKIMVYGGYSGRYLVQLDENGNLNNLFGENGVFEIENSMTTYNHQLMNTDDSFIYLLSVSSSGEFYVSKFNADGELSTSFGDNGKVSFSGFSSVYKLLQNEDSFYVIGKVQADASNIRIVKYDNNGNLDSNFGTNGVFTESYDIGFMTDEIYPVLLDSGDILSLFVNRSDNYLYKYDLLKVTPQGSMLSSFGSSGIYNLFTQESENSLMSFSAIKQNQDGKITIAGSSIEYNEVYIYHSNVARLYESLNVVEPQIGQPKLVFYPNPVKGELRVNSDKKISSFKIYSMNGELVKRGMGNTYVIDLIGLKSGDYIVQVEVGGELINEKIILK